MTSLSINRSFLRSKTARLICGRNLAPLPKLAPALCGRADKICLVSDRNCLAAFERYFKRMLGSLCRRTFVFTAPNGESAKNFKTLESLLSFMMKNGASRRSLVIAAGGGSVTDLAGLAAALYMRGVDWISVPTTLLGQADAGIGGKTAVNLGGVKNAAGAFYQPALTVCDTAFLDTLSGKELRSAAGELIKYSLLAPGRLGRTISENLPGALKGVKKNLAALTAACAAFKLDLVAKDEREETGHREILNLGHTAGHAFEALSNGRLTHGGSVLWGLRYAASLSRKLRLLDLKHAHSTEAALRYMTPPPLPPACLNFARFARMIRLDKKSGGHKNRFILIVRPGVLQAVNDIPNSVLRGCLEELRS
jgi:3-dehydroquinate synthase